LVFGGTERYLGHNPLGAYMVIALLGMVLLQASFGLFAVDDNDLTGGPLYRLVSEDTNKWATSWHGWLFDMVLLPLVAVHVSANVLYGVVKKESLVKAMLTGEKPAADYADMPEATIASHMWTRAVACLAAAVLIVLGAILGLGGRL
jgi:cytochrome b